MNILFMGSGSFAIATLTRIINNNQLNLVAIYTGQPKQKNRGHKFINNIVHEFALNNNFDVNKIFHPDKLNTFEEIERIKNFKPDIIVVVAFGKIIPESIIGIATKEIINLHPSSLPKYRGAAPIERAIESGDNEIDICIIKICKELDAGDILNKVTFSFSNKDHASDVIDKISNIGADLMMETINQIQNNNYKITSQNVNLEEKLIYAKKITKEELLLNFNEDVVLIYNKIRAFNSHGCVYFIYNNEKIKILKADYIIDNTLDNVQANQLIEHFDIITGHLHVKNGKILPLIIQREGRNFVNIKDFLNGIRNKFI